MSALVAYLNMRLTTVSCNLNSTEHDRIADRKEYKTLLDNFSVLVKEYWPREVSASYGTNEIRYLCDRFGLDFSTHLGLFRLYLDRDGQSVSADLVPLINLLKIIPISTSEDERGFSAMNMVCKDLRNRLSVENNSCILFIKINGPPIEQFSPENYVKLWLRSHQCAENKRNTGRQNDEREITKKGRWNFL